MQKSIDLLYVGNNRLPSEKADGLYVMKLCEAFVAEGVRVTLLVPKRINPIREDPFLYYGTKKNFFIHTIPSFDLLFLSRAPLPLMKLFFVLQAVTFGIVAAFFAGRWATFDSRQRIIISHEPYTLFFLSFFSRFPASTFLAFDLHVGAKNNLFWRRVCARVTHFFVLTSGVGETLKALGVRAPITISPDAVDIGLFGNIFEKSTARAALNLPPHAYLCVYAGHLYSWKGIDTVLDAAQFLPPDVILYCVGGTDSDIAERKAEIARRGLRNIVIVGRKPHGEIPRWLYAADVLLLPNSGKEAISRLYTSPMKMFEYMTSEKPIVASRLPSLMEILNDANAMLVESDNPRALAEGILQLKNDPDHAERLAKQAKKDAAKYSWEKKAERMLRALPL